MRAYVKSLMDPTLAYKLTTHAPDEEIPSTHLSTEKKKNFMKKLYNSGCHYLVTTRLQ